MGILKNMSQDDAKEIKYNNTVSGLNALTVQSAIDVLNTNITTLSTRIETIPTLTGWNDLVFEITNKNTGSSSPNWEKVSNTSFFGYNFSTNKECNISFIMRKDFKLGGQAFFQVHWFSDGTDLNSVKWRIDYTIATPNGTFFNPSKTIFIEQNGSGIPFKYMVSSTNVSIDTTNLTYDSVILVRLSRIQNKVLYDRNEPDFDDDESHKSCKNKENHKNNVYGLAVKLHYQTL